MSMTQKERIAAMADIMVKARQAQEDVGELVAAALHTAVEQLGNAYKLVSRRTGSWEADFLLLMAQTGGYGNQERIKALSEAFVAMGEADVDGGDEVSRAMSQAVDELGGLDLFAGMSQWYQHLVGLGCQYSRYPFTSASVYSLPLLQEGDGNA